MKKLPLNYLVAMFVAIFMLIGCGGGKTPVTAQASFSLAWPERTRVVNAPSSALSARFTLSQTPAVAADLILNTDRGVALTANTVTLTFSEVRNAGLYTLQGIFYSAAGQTGSVVGTVSVPVRLMADGSLAAADGTPLGTIVFDGTIKSVVIGTIPDTVVGDTRQLSATAFDANSSAVVVSEGSFNYSITTGSNRFSITSSGLVTALSVGSATAVAMVDGVSSLAQSLNAIPTPLSVVAIQVNDLAYDPISDKIIAVVQNTGQYAGNVLSIDPLTGDLSNFIQVGLEANCVAVTDDGQYAYISIPADNSVRRVNLITKAVDLIINNAGGAVDLATVPGHPETIIVAADPTGGLNLSVFDDGVKRSGRSAGGWSIVMASETKLYGGGLGGSLFETTLSPGQITRGDQTENLVDSAFNYYNGKLYTATGRIVDPVTKTLLKVLPQTNFRFDKWGAVSASDNRAYFVTWDGSSSKRILSFDLTSETELPIRDNTITPGGARGLVACNNHTVAFYTYGTTPREVYIVRNLP